MGTRRNPRGFASLRKMLLAAQAVRLLGGEEQRAGAIRPGQAAAGALIGRPLGGRAASENTGFTKHHDVAYIGSGGADEIDGLVGLDPAPHRLGAGAGLAGAAAGENEPGHPIAGRRQLIVAGPEAPVVGEDRALLLRQPAEQAEALWTLIGEKIAHVADGQGRRFN